MGSHIQSVMVLSTQFIALLGCLALAVDAAPAPLPEPVPEPFFGLGLLGRLLAAYSRGEKEEDFGNCKCNRRTFHTKEKDKDKGCPCDTYGAPVSYNAPSYEPIDDYGAPLAPVYGAPTGGCDCSKKCNRRTFHTKPEKQKEKDKECDCVCDGYGAPSSGYGAPSHDYQAPSVGYGAPVESYGAPVDSYGAPIQSYAAPCPSYGVPETGYGAPSSGYGAPSSGYGAPSSVCACDRTFGPHKEKEKEKDKGCDCSGYPTYEYGAPAVSYEPPAPAYNAPSYSAPSYNAPSYNAPSYNPCNRRTFGPHKNKEKDPCKTARFFRL